MAEQIPATPAEEKSTVPTVGGFAPQISTHQVAALTLGRKKANDADKSNYFED